MGGSAALYYSVFFPKSVCIALNPQIISNFNDRNIVFDNCFKNAGLETDNKFTPHNLPYHLQNTQAYTYIVVNKSYYSGFKINDGYQHYIDPKLNQAEVTLYKTKFHNDKEWYGDLISVGSLPSNNDYIYTIVTNENGHYTGIFDNSKDNYFIKKINTNYSDFSKLKGYKYLQEIPYLIEKHCPA